jgi:hypothetical protein
MPTSMRSPRGGAKFLAALALAIVSSAIWAQATPKEADLPVTKVVLFSSGVGYFEHRGKLAGDSIVRLPFRAEEMNDALKSLIVSDGSGSDSGSPSVSYPSQESLDRALSGLGVDLSGTPAVADLLARMRGAEVSADTPETVTGRIVSVERRPTKEAGVAVPYLALLTSSGLRSVSLDEVVAIRFTDKGLSEDFGRALELILEARDQRTRTLEVRMPGTGTRQAAIGYVVEAPIWKASYRLDLSAAKPLLQGWAVVDNPTDQDWKGVALSLVSGRPVSFIQDLYSPLYIDRPTIPLAIAGTASARSFDSGFAADKAELDYAAEAEGPSMKRAFAAQAPAPAAAPMMSESKARGSGAAEALPLGTAGFETAQARSAGDQFEFTIKKPVSLERRKSAMLSLVSGEIAAEKVSVYNPAADSKRPMLGARLENSTGMKLPAGPITVFDGGVYAGDALLDFLPERDRRLIVFGEDLGVSADASSASSEETTAVTVAKGVMTFTRRVTFARTYAFKNSTSIAKKMIIEHPITPGAELYEPQAYDEKTAAVYRLGLALPAAAEAKLVVKERMPRRDSVTLASLSQDAFLSYSSSKEIPQAIRDALKKAIELRGKTEDAKRSLAELQARRQGLAEDQSRYRDNLDSVGRDSSQGQQYLKRLMDAETAIEQLDAKIADAKKTQTEAQRSYESYISNLSL